MDNVSSNKSWHWKYFRFCKSVEGEGVNYIVEGWLIVDVTSTHSEDSTHSTRCALYQGPKPNRPQGNPGLLPSQMQLYCHSWRIIHVKDMNCHLVPEVFYGVHIWTFVWLIHDFHILVLKGIPNGSDCVGRSIISYKEKDVLEGGSCSG